MSEGARILLVEDDPRAALPIGEMLTATQLSEAGCDGAQGFLLGRPVPECDVEALLTG